MLVVFFLQLYLISWLLNKWLVWIVPTIESHHSYGLQHVMFLVWGQPDGVTWLVWFLKHLKSCASSSKPCRPYSDMFRWLFLPFVKWRKSQGSFLSCGIGFQIPYIASNSYLKPKVKLKDRLSCDIGIQISYLLIILNWRQKG